ncbi:MAG: biotin--[acetyl-CoA-carboxylase] ligase [Elusimicrobiota bacterium]|jgi:BirA family biotin operon repressor/biotin-[acetyl-CoA-carboxylase] ligase|nr:biotin--[acetyl-CoA-carboxylase] ligase [Elusimicrobiota bacterium]
MKLFSEIKSYKAIGSTQTKAKHLAQKNYPQGTVVMSDRQTKAYGRDQKKWLSPAGGLWFSFILRPEIWADEAVKLSQVAALALQTCLEKKIKVPAQIKWPNDILFCNKKLAGIIVEMSVVDKTVEWVAVGIGINVNNPIAPEFSTAAVSLKDVKGAKVDKKMVFEAFCCEFERIYKEFIESGFDSFAAQYNQKTAFLNSKVEIINGSEHIEGIYKGIDANANLVLQTPHQTRHFASGTLRSLK